MVSPRSDPAHFRSTAFVSRDFPEVPQEELSGVAGRVRELLN